MTKKLLCIALTTALMISGPAPAASSSAALRASGSATASLPSADEEGGSAALEDLDSHIIWRVDTQNNDGLVRSRYQTPSGEDVTLPKHRTSPYASRRAAPLPSSWDSRENGSVTPVRDQGVTGGCWAFGALKSLESSSILKNISSLDKTDYSENHLIWYTYHRLTDTSDPLYGDYLETDIVSEADYYDLGGNAYMAMFALANWWGAVREETAPFSAGSAKELQTMAATMKAQGDSLRTQSDVHLKEAVFYDNASLDDIKQAVIDHGSLDVSVYYDKKNMYSKNGITSAYETTCTPDDANHCVAIIGWDDSFNTFHTSAPDSGAWLIANSYGTDSGMDGCYWVSYYDTSLCEFCSFEAEETDQYDTDLQYDGMGWSSLLHDTADMAFANIFTNAPDAPRRIGAAGFYTASDGQPYQIQVYRHTDKTSPVSGELIGQCTTSGYAEYAGYHTVALDETAIVDPGETFSVVVTFPSNNDKEVYVAVEGNNDPEFSSHSSRAGESFLFMDGEWYDNTSLPDGSRILNMNNV